MPEVEWEGVMGGHQGYARGHMQVGDFGRDLLVRENLQLLGKGDAERGWISTQSVCNSGTAGGNQ